MKKLITVIAVFSFVVTNAQTTVNLKLNHHWNGDPFNYGQLYEDEQGRKIEISRVQYYICAFDMVHDGGTNTSLGDSILLVSSNITDYVLADMNISNLESIDFAVGVNSLRNNEDPAQYPASHPLALHNPSMHWGWTGGYKFICIEGMADSDNDDVPDATFELHVTGDNHYFMNVTPITTSAIASGSVLDVELYVNVADWLVTLDLATVGLKHGVYPACQTIVNNTNDYTVFTSDLGLGVDESFELMNNVQFDYTQSYAPTIFYKFPASQYVDLTITDMNGRIVLAESKLPKADNYFIEKELAAGTYIAVFKTDTDETLSEKFVVSQ